MFFLTPSPAGSAVQLRVGRRGRTFVQQLRPAGVQRRKGRVRLVPRGSARQPRPDRHLQGRRLHRLRRRRPVRGCGQVPRIRPRLQSRLPRQILS